MEDSLEARLAALPAIEADVLPYGEWLVVWQAASSCCVQNIMRANGCDAGCLHGSAGNWFYHGSSAPTVETIQQILPSRLWTCPACGMLWKDIEDTHPRISTEFDEEAERARLMPV